MTKIITYVAYDNTEFSREEDCRQYEQTVENVLKQLEGCEFFDYNKKPRVFKCQDTLLKTLDEFDRIIGTAFYVKIPYELDALGMKDLESYTGCYMPPCEPGYYMANDDTEKWELVPQ